MKLIKFAAVAGVAMVLAAVLSKVSVQASSNDGATAGSRSIATGSVYSSGVMYPLVQGGSAYTSNYRGPMTSVTVDYSAGNGNIILQDVNGIFRAGLSASNINNLSLGANGLGYFIAGGNVTAPAIAGAYTTEAGDVRGANAYISIYGNNSKTIYYWDFSYNTTTGTATATQQTLASCIPVHFIVRDASTNEVLWGATNGGASYAFFNESTNTGMNLPVLSTYAGVLNVKP
jgi:hypothetical protein